MSNKGKVVFSLTNEFHDDITNIYELTTDEQDEEAIEKIDELRSKLKALKDNITKKEDI